MDYEETIEFLFSSLPMYQRVGKAAYKANLDNTLKLDGYFGHPHHSYPTIHVAGTNGKGSVCHMLASVLQEAGYRTGLYTSPHLIDFRERIRINGEPIPEEEVTGFVTLHRKIIEEVHPSFFEMTVAMAFDYFARRKVDVAVIETGLGGRLDSTNIVAPEVAVITNIAMDHMEFLGDNLDAIAREKGGIIKKGIPLVIGRAGEGTERVLLEMAEEKQAPVSLAFRAYEPLFQTLDQEMASLFRIRDRVTDEVRTIGSDLNGQVQMENLITALTTLEVLKEKGWEVPERAMERGFASVSRNTGLMGRWQTIGQNPRSICDTAHNPDGVARVVKQLGQVPRKELHMVWGMVQGKPAGQIFSLLPPDARYYFTSSSVPRSVDPETLRDQARAYGLEGTTYGSVKEAYAAARKAAGPDDLIFTGGSTFVVADLLNTLE
ncbi:MAG: bifunctional folylpolyglutamate synthase/dihydrofolate synthase [Bacteroidales bacterium]